MLIPVGYGQATIQFTGNSCPSGADITFGFENEGDATALECASFIAGEFQNAEVMDLISNQCTASNCHVKLGPNDDGPFADYPFSSTGQIATSSVPPNTSVLVKKLTALGGRQGQGRLFFPGWPENKVDDGGVLAETERGLFQIDFVEWMAALTVGSVIPVVLHNGAITPTPITSFAVQAVAATQRRRMRR